MKIRSNGPYFVNLGDDSIHNFSFKGTEHNGFVFDGIQHKTSARLDNTCPNIIDCGYCNNKAIPGKQKRDSYFIMIFSEKVRSLTLCWTYFPVHVPSTSVNSFCLTVFSRLGPKYRGCRRISCSREICCDGYRENNIKYKTILREIHNYHDSKSHEGKLNQCIMYVSRICLH